MSKCRIVSEPQAFEVPIKAMPPGSYGMDANGHLYYASHYDAICLSNSDGSYSGNKGIIDAHFVRLLPPGTIIQIAVE